MRLLGSSSRSQSATRKVIDKGKSHRKPSLEIHVPSYGILYLSLVPESSELDNNLRPTRELKGEVEIRIPPHLGARRCKRLRVGFRSVSRLAMGERRGWEEDIIEEEEKVFDNELVLRGSTRIEFTFRLKPLMPVHDWHPEAKLRYEIWAELEGVASSSLLPKSLRIGSRSPSASRAVSPRPSRHHTPLASPTLSPSSSGPPSPRIAGHMPLPDFSQLSVDTIPRVPSYEQSEAEASGRNTPAVEDLPMLEGIYRAVRPIKAVYNPSPTRSTTNLDDRLQGMAPGLGPYLMHLRSPLWVVSALLYTRFQFLDLPPTATLYDIRVSIVQTITIKSPRDGATEVIPRVFPILKIGHRPSSEMKRPPVAFPALWRGVEAGGTDVGEWVSEGKGRLPSDDVLRPSTLEGIVTPVHNAHKMLVEATFSLWGLNADDTPTGKSCPGESRRLKLSKAVILPGCPNIPQVLGLPEYDTRPSDMLSQPNMPCPMCHMLVEDRVCLKCPFTVNTHPRHDHPPKLVGTADGTCPVCSVSLLHEKEQNWVNCACALTDEDMEALAGGMVGPGGAQRGLWREADAGGVQGSKEDNEYEDRGRSISRC